MIVEAHENRKELQGVSMTNESIVIPYVTQMESGMLANAVLVADSMGVRLNLTSKSTVMDIAAQVIDGLEEIDAWHEAGYWRQNFNVMGWL
jgi:hypothetical protein